RAGQEEVVAPHDRRGVALAGDLRPPQDVLAVLRPGAGQGFQAGEALPARSAEARPVLLGPWGRPDRGNGYLRTCRPPGDRPCRLRLLSAVERRGDVVALETLPHQVAEALPDANAPLVGLLELGVGKHLLLAAVLGEKGLRIVLGRLALPLGGEVG